MVHGFNQARVSGGAEGLGEEPSLGDRGEVGPRVRLPQAFYRSVWNILGTRMRWGMGVWWWIDIALSIQGFQS